MKRKISDIPTRIYSYRVLSPVTEAMRVEDQFRLAAHYRNALVEVEHWLRDRFRAVQLEHPVIGPALRLLEDAQAGVDHAYDELRMAKSGTTTPDLAGPRDRLAIAKDLLAIAITELHEAKRPSKLLGVAHKAAAKLAELERSAADAAQSPKPKAKVDATVIAAAAALMATAEAEAAAAAAAATIATPDDEALLASYDRERDAAYVRSIAARTDFRGRGLRTGTYEKIENAIKQAAKSTKRPLRFERYDGGGAIGTQLIGGVTVSELHSCLDTRIRLPALPDNYWQLPRNRRRHAARLYAELRVGTNPNRSPIFAKFPVVFHRPLPKDAVIKWAYVMRHRVGHYLEWRLQLTIESETFCTPTQPVGEGACAVNLGWRRILDDQGDQIGLRAGYLVDANGLEREIMVPEKLWSGVAKVYELAGTRDKEMDAVRDALTAYLHHVGDRAPAWLVEETRGLPQWRAQRKMQKLVDVWTGIDWEAWRAARAEGRKCNPSDFGSGTNRSPEDGVIVARLKAWANHDRHLQRWQETQRDRIYAHRKETWRVLAAELANKYATIVVEETKYPEIDGWDQPEPEDGNPSEGREQRRMSRLAAPGELRGEIVKAAIKRGAQTIVSETRRITQDCSWCDYEDDFDAAASITHRCGGCARLWDQDANAARNLLKKAGFLNEAGGEELPPEPEPVPAQRKASSSRASSGSATLAALT